MPEQVIMSDEQFARLIETIGRANDDHDLLIEIKAILMNEKENTLRQRNMCREDFGSMKTSITKAHSRLDSLLQKGLPVLVTLILALIAAVGFIRG